MVVETLSPLVVGLLPLGLAFSLRVRKQILNRDGRRCVECGSTQNLQCAHYNHDHSRPEYNDPSNGRVLCLEHHLQDHRDRHGRADLGLSNEANLWAIRMMESKLPVDVDSMVRKLQENKMLK